MYKCSKYTCHKLLIVLKISFILVIYWDKKPLSCYFTIWTKQLKNEICSFKASWRYLCIWTLILQKVRETSLYCSYAKTRYLIVMVPHSNWLWTVTTDPVWHFPHQNVTKYIKVSCYSFNMNSMQYFGKYSPCTRCTCTEGIEI
jgi:hypothetical protein